MRLKKKCSTLSELANEQKPKRKYHKRKKRRARKKKKNRTPASVRANYKIEALERLAADIVECAVNDYRKAGFEYKTLVYKLDHHLMANSEKVVTKRKTLLAEMKRDRYFIEHNKLTNLDPQFAMEELDKQIKDYDPAEHLKQIYKGGNKHGRI